MSQACLACVVLLRWAMPCSLSTTVVLETDKVLEVGIFRLMIKWGQGHISFPAFVSVLLVCVYGRTAPALISNTWHG